MAENFIKTKGMEHYVIINNDATNRNLSSGTHSKKIQLAVDLTNNRILDDAYANWSRGNNELYRLQGKTPFGAWSSANFAFGIDLG